MKSYQSRIFRSTLRCLTATAALLLISTCAALAQGPPAGGGGPPIVNPKGETDAQTGREASLRSAEMPASTDQASQRRLAAAIEQTKQDFKRIQLIRNDLIDELLAKKPLDYKQVAEQTAEINKRAVRLKVFMMPTKPEEKKTETESQAEVSNEELKGALVKLCNLIRSFTGNPMFKDLSTLDLKESAKAGSDLLAIIETSDFAKRGAERLSKSEK